MVYSPKLLCYSIFSYRPFAYKLTFQQHCSFCNQHKTDVPQTFVQADMFSAKTMQMGHIYWELVFRRLDILHRTTIKVHLLGVYAASSSP